MCIHIGNIYLYINNKCMYILGTLLYRFEVDELLDMVHIMYNNSIRNQFPLAIADYFNKEG